MIGFLKKHPILRILLILIFIWSLIAIWPRPMNVPGENPFSKDIIGRPLLIAHGGGNLEFPDNTLEAFYHAYHVDPNVMMETDVSLTKDGVIILSHDTTLDRKTSLQNAPIIEINYQDLIDDVIDFGYENAVEPRSNGFNVSGDLIRYTNYLGQTVTPEDVIYPESVTARHPEKFLATTLEELIMAFPNNPINVEIKQSGEIGLAALDAVITLFDRLDNDYNTYARIVLASFHEEIYDAFVTLKETSHSNLMFSPQQQGVIKYYAMHLLRVDVFYRDPVAVLQVPTGQFGIDLSTKAFIRIAQRHNIAVHYWTIDDPDEMRRLILQGADGIMTNRPTLLKEVIDEFYPN